MEKPISVVDEPRLPNPRGRPFALHEFALIALGLGTTLALLLRGRGLHLVLLEVFVGSTLYGSVIMTCPAERFRIRFLASYAFVTWFYLAIGRITPALGTTPRDGALLAIDKAIFGQTPAIFCERMVTPKLTDVMSLCYMTYLVYLCVAVAHAALVANTASKRLSTYLFTGFAIGFTGYLLVPAVGPAYAYPELFGGPLPGDSLTRVLTGLVGAGSSVYDTFPSLHVLITSILLDHDWREVRRRFWLVIVPSMGLVFSTIYLRYHYGVDIVVAFVLFLVLRRTFLKGAKREVTLRS